MTAPKEAVALTVAPEDRIVALERQLEELRRALRAEQDHARALSNRIAKADRERDEVSRQLKIEKAQTAEWRARYTEVQFQLVHTWNREQMEDLVAQARLPFMATLRFVRQTVHQAHHEGEILTCGVNTCRAATDVLGDGPK